MSLPLFLSLAIGTATAASPESPKPAPESTPTACDAAIVEANDHDLPADKLNALGMRCYKEKRYDHAAELFFEAIKRDENHALANYNFACVLALLLDTLGPCDMNHDWESAFSHLRRSIVHDPKRAERARVDRDFDALRKMLAFRLAVHGTPTTAQQTANLYDGVTLWGETPGVALMAEVRFQRTHSTALTGTVHGWVRDFNLEQIPANGTWRAEGATLIVDWAARTPSEGPVIPGSTETIRIDEMNQYGGHGGWYTAPDWCSA